MLQVSCLFVLNFLFFGIVHSLLQNWESFQLRWRFWFVILGSWPLVPTLLSHLSATQAPVLQGAVCVLLFLMELSWRVSEIKCTRCLFRESRSSMTKSLWSFSAEIGPMRWASMLLKDGLKLYLSVGAYVCTCVNLSEHIDPDLQCFLYNQCSPSGRLTKQTLRYFLLKEKNPFSSFLN